MLLHSRPPTVYCSGEGDAHFVEGGPVLRYAKKLLIADEEFKCYTKRNEIVSFYKPVLLHLGLLIVAVGIWQLAAVPGGWWLVLLALVLPFPYTFYIWLWWVNKYYIVTNFRVMKVEGILNKTHRDASLDQVNDLILTAPLIGRILGYGHLTVMTANERSITYHFIKHPVTFKKTLTGWKEHAERYGIGPPKEGDGRFPKREQEEPPEDPISQIERLGELVKKGLLSQQEFEAKKKELLEQIE